MTIIRNLFQVLYQPFSISFMPITFLILRIKQFHNQFLLSDFMIAKSAISSMHFPFPVCAHSSLLSAGLQEA